MLRAILDMGMATGMATDMATDMATAITNRNNCLNLSYGSTHSEIKLFGYSDDESN
jgi:hypothetical protein